MSIPEPHHVDVARDADVEPLIRATRAELAQRTLELRTARHEADQLEAGLAHDGHDDARDLLRRSLEEFVESRRAELEAALDRELVRAAAATTPAEEESASDAATSAPEPVPPRRLQAVPDPSAFEDPAEEPDEPGKGEAGPAGASDVVTDDATTDDDTTDDDTTDDDGATDDDVDGETGPVGHASAMIDPPPRPAQVPDPPATDSSATTPGFEATAVPDPALLRELVSAAVTAAVSQASALMGGSAQHRSWTPPPQELTTTYPVVAGHRPARRPFWLQLLHADVLLPLILILIVFVVLLAWVG